MTPAGKTVYPVKAINVLKAHGKSARESALLKGYALNLGRASQGMPKAVTGARVACLDMNLQRARMHMGIQARPEIGNQGCSVTRAERQRQRAHAMACWS